jgi:hypothetical protein
LRLDAQSVADVGNRILLCLKQLECAVDVQVAKTGVFNVRLLQVRVERKLRVAYDVQSTAELVPVSGAAQQPMLLAAPVDPVSNFALKFGDAHRWRRLTLR